MGSGFISKSIVLEILSYIDKLRKVGVSEEQAKVQAEALVEIINKTLVTKDDLKELETRLTMRLGTMMTAAIAIVATLVKIL